MAVRAERQSGAGVSRRSSVRWTSETKHAFKTTEFWAMVAVIAGILVASWVIDDGEGNGDAFQAERAWLYVAIVAGAYMISRGLAKAGSYEPRDDDYDTTRGHDGN